MKQEDIDRVIDKCSKTVRDEVARLKKQIAELQTQLDVRQKNPTRISVPTYGDSFRKESHQFLPTSSRVMFWPRGFKDSDYIEVEFARSQPWIVRARCGEGALLVAPGATNTVELHIARYVTGKQNEPLTQVLLGP